MVEQSHAGAAYLAGRHPNLLRDAALGVGDLAADVAAVHVHVEVVRQLDQMSA